MHTIHRLCRDCIGQNLPQVSVLRGSDGFGFTIFSDHPVRVQAVDPGGPAQRSGIRQGDSVLQLNGLPVDTWTCADLAQAIRSCPSRVILAVWRGLPELSSACETWLRPQLYNPVTSNKFASHPAHSKHSNRWGQGHGLRSRFRFLGSLWRDGKEDQNQEDTRVTSSNGDNYIILSPVAPGEQLLQPAYHTRNGTIGRLYQTHPSGGQNLLHTDTRMSQLASAGHTSALPVSQPTVLGPPGNHGNYQNCTIVQTHLPWPGYGDTSLPPKTVIFPFFVQPLDFCSPVRTLRMSEEMILHQADLLPSKVSVLIFFDLLLLAREEEGGRCTVLRSPLYLNALRLREVPWEPLRLHLLQRSAGGWRRVFSLEAFDTEQKVRVGLCLRDDRWRCLVAMETTRPWQLSDFGLVCHPSSPFSHCSPVFPCEPAVPTPSAPPSEGQQRESPSEVSDPGGSRRRPLISQEEERGCRPPVLRRSLSEGSLLQEARLSHFLSDSTIHQLIPTSTFDQSLPPPSCPPQLTKEGASLHHMLLLLNGAKEGKSSNVRLKEKKTKSLPSEGEVRRWADSLEALLTNQYGVEVFRDFLRSEFSEENLDFWLAVEKFKRTHSLSKMATQAGKINDQLLSPCAARQVNADSTNHSLSLGVDPASFQRVQDQIFNLMEADSYPRFLKSHLYAQLANHNAGTAVELSNQTNQSVIV